MKEPIIVVDDKDALLEITQRCYTGCSYCYKAGDVSPAMPHVPLSILKQRIDWINAYTNANELYILGGEPLLYPELDKLTDYIIGKSLDLVIITSGKASDEVKSNIDLVLNLYKKGMASIELSYHPKRNDKQFKYWFKKLNELVPERIANLKNRKKELEGSSQDRSGLLKKIDEYIKEPTLHTTATIGEEITSNEENYLEIFKLLVKECSGIELETATFTPFNSGATHKLLDELNSDFNRLCNHFKPFDQSQNYSENYRIAGQSNVNFKWSIRAWGATGVKPIVLYDGENRIETKKISRAKGTVQAEAICPAMKSKTENNKVYLDSLLIRADGEITFSQPSCINARMQFGNIDELANKDEIYVSFKQALEWIKQVIFETKAARASSTKLYCKSDSRFTGQLDRAKYICPSCEFDLACNICNAADRRTLPDADYKKAIAKWTDLVKEQVLKS